MTGSAPPDDGLRESGDERDAHPGFRLRSSCCGGLRPPMTAREIADALMADKAPLTTRNQAIDLQAAILSALRKRNGGMVVGKGAPARWKLKGFAL